MVTYGVKNSDILSALYKSYTNKLRISSPLIPSCLEPMLNSDKVLEAKLSYYKIREHVSLVPRPPSFVQLSFCIIYEGGKAKNMETHG